MLEAVSEGLLFVIEIIRRFVRNLLISTGPARQFLLYGIALGITISVVLLVVKLIKRTTWGS